jgi:hypothetical protein
VSYGGGVVQDEVHVEVGGYFGVDLAEKRRELGGAVAGVQRSDDPPLVRSRAA